MAETETSKALSQETGKTTDLYSQNKLKLNFNSVQRLNIVYFKLNF